MGGLIFAASTAASELDHSTWMQENPWVSVVLGVVIAGLVHTGKMAARPVINIGTAGTGAPVVSTVEDGASFGLSVIALIAPVLAAIAVVPARVAAHLDVAPRAPMARTRRDRDRPTLTATAAGSASSTTFEGGGSVKVCARSQSEKTRSDGAVLGADGPQQPSAAVGGHPQARSPSVPSR